jgi:hypothetical protein
VIDVVKIVFFVCDQCSARLRVEISSSMGRFLPTGWTAHEVGPCGMTDHYREEHLCPKCSKKTKRGS